MRRRTIVTILVMAALLLVASAVYAAKTKPSYARVSNPQQLNSLLNNWADIFEDYYFIFDPQTSAPSNATEGMVYYNNSANLLYFYNGSAWASLSSGAGNSLDGAYDLGSKIDVDGDNLELEVDDNSNNSALLIDMDDATNDPAALVITNDADAAAAVSIQIDGTAGYDIQGTSDTWEISIAGALTTSGGFTIEAADCLFDDTYDVAWDTSRDTLIFQDNAVLGIGGAHDAAPDVGIRWDTSNMLIEAATDNTGQIRLGSTNSMDFAIYGSTNTNIFLFDVSAATIESNGWTWVVQDDDNLNFGDSDEFQIEYDEDGTDNLIIVAANANDAVQIGDGTTNTDMIWKATSEATTYTNYDASGDTNRGIWNFGQDDWGQDVYFHGATASQYVLWDQSGDTWYFGADAEGVDVYLNANTTGDFFLWDESDEALEGVGVQLHLDDDSQLQLGSTAGDVYLQFDGSNFLIDASTADEGLLIGDATTGFDLAYRFETAGEFRSDYDGDFVNLTDDMDLRFGTGATSNGDFQISSGSTNVLAIEQVASGTGTITIGADNKGIDTTFYAETASDYMMWDQDGNTQGALVFEDSHIRMQDDTTLLFGDDADVSIQYDADGQGQLQITGIVGGYRLQTENVSANDTLNLTRDLSGKVFIVDGNTATVQLTLPSVAAAQDGWYYTFVDANETAASDVQIEPNDSDTINGTADGFSSDGADKLPCSVTLMYDHSNTDWTVISVDEEDTGTAAWDCDS